MNLQASTEEFSRYSMLTATLSGFLFGYQTAVIAGAIIFITPEFGLSVFSQGWVVSILLLGCIVGAACSGTLADRWGRRTALQLSAVIFIVGAVLLGHCPSYAMLLMGRLLSGLGVGIASVVTPLYIAEISPAERRGTYVTLYQLAVTIGILVCFVVGFLLADSGNWRLMFMLGGLPALLQSLLLFGAVESPAWLGNKNSRKQAPQTTTPEASTASLLANAHFRRLLLLGLILSIFQQISGINAVIYYAPKIFSLAGFSSASSAIGASLAVGVFNVLATLVSVYAMDRLGRRPLLLIGSGGMTLSLAMLAGTFMLDSPLTATLSVLSLMAYVGFFAIGLGPITWVLLAELYPLAIRGKAMTIALFANWGVNYLVSLSFLSLIDHGGTVGTFLTFALISLGAFCFVFWCIPETKGRALDG